MFEPQDLVALREIEELKYRYMRTLDLKDWGAFAECFEPEATARYGERLQFESRDEIVEFMARNLGPSMISTHLVHHPELKLDGDTATGTWALEDRVIMTEHRYLLQGASTYYDEYRRGADGAWRVTHTSYDRIFESMTSLDDMPSFNLTANRWGP